MENKHSVLPRLVGTILGLTFLVLLIVAVIGLVFRWNTAVQFSNAFFVAGAILIALGTFSITGGFHQRASFPLTYAETASHASMAERGQRMMADINQRYGAMILLTGTGILMIGISIAIPKLF